MTNMVLTEPVGGTSSAGATLTDINGQPTVVFEDTVRNKTLSVSEHTLTFTATGLNNQDWLSIGNASAAETSFIAELDGTICFASGQCTNVDNNDKTFRVYVNGVNTAGVGTVSGAGSDSFINTGLNVDFNQGDTIRIRAVNGNNGRIRSTTVRLTTRWRA